MTLICAPAGFGKTTLVNNWVHEVEYLTLARLLIAQDNLEAAGLKQWPGRESSVYCKSGF